MLKSQRQEEPKRSFLVSCLMLLLICVCVLHTFVVFHTHLNKSPISSIVGINGAPQKVVLNRGGLMNALKEEGRSDSSEIRTRVEIKPTKPSLYKPPLNVTEAERIKWFTENYSSFDVLHPDAMASKFQAKVKAFFHSGCKGRFFMTWIAPLKSFGPRELLSIESVFKFHPNSCLLIISRTLDSVPGSELLFPIVARGFKIMAAAPDLNFLFKNTPAESWLADMVSGRTDPGEIPFPQNLSNILRLVALYKYGGTYIDSDVIVVRRLSKLRNAIGAQNVDPDTGVWNRLNNAVLVFFDKKHPLLFKFIQEFALTYNGNKWGHNGPYLVTRVLNRLVNRSGEGFQVQVLSPMAFYPVDWTRIHSFFSRPTGVAGSKWKTAKLLQMEGETYALHLWNKQSREFVVEEESIMHDIFNKCCIICDYRYFLQRGRTRASKR